MKKSILAAAAALVIGTGVALAQTVVISPEQSTTIKSYVVKEKIGPITLREKVVVGQSLPADVKLVTVPEAWGPSVRPYHYVYSDNRVYLVNPTDRKVVHIID